MSTENQKKEKKWGGSREGSGRKKGTGKSCRLSITVDESRLKKAMKEWGDKKSRLFDHLLTQYIEGKA